MKRTSPAALEQLLSAYRQRCGLALLFDYDGTLTPIVEHPSLAQLDSRVSGCLAELARLPNVFVGILSGRRIDELEQMVGLPGLYYAGTSGLELNFRGTRIAHPDAEKCRTLLDKVRSSMEQLAAGYNGAWLEAKPLGMTVHFRNVAPGQTEWLRREVIGAISPVVDQLRVLDGPHSLEITPALGWTKGTAVRRMVEDIGTNPLPLYAGDETNDADALETVNSLGGISIGVGPRAPNAAQFRLPAPVALMKFLDEFLATIQTGGQSLHA